MEKTWTSSFPEGSMISNYRCFDPNSGPSSYHGEEHSATCVCSGGNCSWDRELPVCTNHGMNHSGYTWLMSANPSEGDICVSVNTGGVGTVVDGKCSIGMATELDGFYTAAQGNVSFIR